MTEALNADLRVLARTIADRVAGRDAIEDVVVEPEVDDLGRETHRFVFRFSSTLSPEDLGRIRSELHFGVRDALIARGEETPPVIRLLDHQDWDRRLRA